jgi:formylglycine-generating enzyme required for sulfatase activity
MGSPTNEVGRNPTNENQTQVTLTQGFFMGKFEVTQIEFLSVVGSYPQGFTGPYVNSDPMNYITDTSYAQNSATNYCALLTTRDLALFRIPAGWAYRLPTEAEWEYACRAGTATVFHYGNALYNNTNQGTLAWFNGQFPYPLTGPSDPTGIKPGGPTNVGSFLPNAFGLYDMHGNVTELCQDTMPLPIQIPVADPVGPLTNPIVNLGIFRIIRGGSWFHEGAQCRSAFRATQSTSPTGGPISGFRVVLAPAGP